MPTYKTDDAGRFEIPTRGKASSIVITQFNPQVHLVVVDMNDTHVIVRAWRRRYTAWLRRWGKPRPYCNKITVRYWVDLEASNA